MSKVFACPIVVALAFAGLHCSSDSSTGGGGSDGGKSDSGAGDSGAADSAADTGVTVQGCSPSDFADKTDAAAMRGITFPMDFTPVQYSPPCMKIKAGQSVTWTGSFTNHPLEAMNGDAGNPIKPTTMGTTVTVAFPTAGTFGFDCANHPSIMKGAILVVP